MTSTDDTTLVYNDPVAGLAALAAAAAAPHGATLEGDRRLLVQRLHTLRAVRDTLAKLDALLTQEVASRLDQQNQLIAGFGYVHRERARDVEWNKAKLADDVRRAIFDRYGTDPETGEVFPLRRQLIELVLRDFAATRSDDPRVAGIKALGLPVDEYRATDLGPWRVTLTPVAGAPDGED